MSERNICIHAHFYQPPRENPGLEAIEVQDSAYPYHDWNERVTAECYAPNGASRILNGDGRIEKITNNYAKISFNFGPTLLSWMQEKSPEVYANVLDADKESQKRFSGHGSAIAQAYNHMILPLANRRDKVTQVRWGICDFQHRFGRVPEGMWLPETAVNMETLSVLAEHGITFTILSPYQARRARAKGTRGWRDVSGGRIDPSRAYLVRLPANRSITVFFYDGPISRAIAFEDLLLKGENLTERLIGAFSDDRDWNQLVHIATDGETYGHHRPHGDMALAYALERIEATEGVRLTNYAEYLAKNPPVHEARIFDSSSWSCAHGIERWRSNCGCNTGGHAGWSQEWRAPLRESLDWLRDELARRFENEGTALLKDPWAARDDYVHVVLDRSPENLNAFLGRHANHHLNEEEITRALKLLEMQRHAMLMYTSCGWFFDELSGMETVQVIQYAGRAIELADEMDGGMLEPQFLERLERAKSNIPEHGDGKRIYEKFVKPAQITLPKVGAHYAVDSIFESFGDETQIYAFTVHREDYKLLTSGKARLALGRARITSLITHDTALVSFSVLHLGDQNISGGVREFEGNENYSELMKGIVEAFERGDFQEVSRLLEKDFGAGTYTLRALFRDEQRKIVRIILEGALAEAEAAYRHFYENHAPLMAFVASVGVPQPKRFRAAAEFTINTELQKAFEAPVLDLGRIEALLQERERVSASLDETTLEFALRRKLEAISLKFAEHPDDIELLKSLDTAAKLARSMPFEVNLWSPQNIYYRMMESSYPDYRGRAERGDESAKVWVEQFRTLGELLRVRVE